MNDNGPPPLFWVFMGVWAVLMIVGYWFFGFKREARLKRAVLPWSLAFAGCLFCFFVLLISGGQLEVFVFVVPAVAIISVMNAKLIRFCDRCGATAYNHNW